MDASASVGDFTEKLPAAIASGKCAPDFVPCSHRHYVLCESKACDWFFSFHVDKYRFGSQHCRIAVYYDDLVVGIIFAGDFLNISIGISDLMRRQVGWSGDSPNLERRLWKMEISHDKSKIQNGFNVLTEIISSFLSMRQALCRKLYECRWDVAPWIRGTQRRSSQWKVTGNITPKVGGSTALAGRMGGL